MMRVLRLAIGTVFGALVAVTIPVTSLPTSIAPLTISATLADDQFQWRGHVLAGQSVEIKGVNGTIAAEPSASGEVEVVADKSGGCSNPADVRIEVRQHEKGVTICAVLYIAKLFAL